MLACGTPPTSLDNGNTPSSTPGSSLPDGAIELTDSNYRTYLSVESYCAGSGTKHSLSEGPYYPNMPLYYDQICAFIKCQPISTHFVFHDVKLTFRVSGDYTAVEDTIAADKSEMDGSFEKEFTLDVDIAGNISFEEILITEIEDGYLVPWYQPAMPVVVEVSGYITPA